MDYPSSYGKRDYSRCDYERRLSEVDFDEKSEEVKKFGKFENIKFFITEGPDDQSKVRKYINELRSHNIRFLARTNRSKYDSNAFDRSGITLIDLDFTVPLEPPEDSSLNDYHDIIKKVFLENKRVRIAIQGYEDGAFIIAFSLMVMGMSRTDALVKIREFEGEVTASQFQYLRNREKDLKDEHRSLLRRRKPRQFVARIIYNVYNAHR